MGGLIFDIHAEVLEQEIGQFLRPNNLVKVCWIYAGKDFPYDCFELQNRSINWKEKKDMK